MKEPYIGMQNNFRLSRTKNNILYIFCGASLALFAGLMLFPTIAESTHAEKQSVTSDGITITFSTDIVADVKTSEYDNYKIVKDTVSVSTDSFFNYGFTVFVSADNSDIYLGGDTSSASKISGIDGTYSLPKPLETNTWGWAAPGVGRFDDAYSVDDPNGKSKFAAMPTEDTIIRDYSSLFAIWDGKKDTDVYYGFKLDGDTLEPGEYITTVKYTAIPQNNPLTAKAILGDNGNLNYVYDRKTYTSGDTYTDNLGEATIVGVSSVPKDRSSCTNSTSSVAPSGTKTSINFDASFVNFKPTSTCGWFAGLNFSGGMTNQENFNTSQVTDMSYMFYQSNRSIATFDLNLSGWDTSKVTDMHHMFFGVGQSNNLISFKLDLSGWDTGSVTNMSCMFMNTGSSNTSTWSVSGLSSWNTANVTDMSLMFSETGPNATTWTLDDLSGWNTGKVTSMNYMFVNAGRFATNAWTLGDLSGWDTSSVTDMSSMFRSAGWYASDWYIGDISDWDVRNVTDHNDFISLCYNGANESVVNNQPSWPN